MPSFLRHIHDCTRFDQSKFVPFIICGQKLGWLTHEVAALLLKNDPTFRSSPEGIELDPALDTFEARSEALARGAAFLSRHYNMPLVGEFYPVIEKWGDEPLGKVDRTSLPWFGLRGVGVHVNGFVREKDGVYLWIAERAADRRIDPGKLDEIIGGGMSFGIGIRENLIKEGWEEAGVDEALALTARPTGSVSYKSERMRGVRNDTLFIFDLELPESFTPRNTDGEVSAFYLMPLADVAAIIRDTDRFKFNCNLVIIDFLLRQGFIGPDHEEYAALAGAMRLVKTD